MDTSMKDKRVVVTAGAQGIGLAIAETMVGAGARVHVCDVAQDALEAVRGKMPAVGTSLTDVADPAQVRTMFDDLAQRWVRSLVAMSHEDPRWRTLMDLEGVKRWLAADPALVEDGYGALAEAVKRQDQAGE